MQEIEQRVHRLEEWAFGNGVEGADEKLRQISQQLGELLKQEKAVERTLRTLEDDRIARNNEAKGIRRGIAIVGSVLLILELFQVIQSLL